MSPRNLRHRQAAILAVAGAAIILAAPLRAQQLGGDDTEFGLLEPARVCVARKSRSRLSVMHPFDRLCRRMCRWGWANHIETATIWGGSKSIRPCTRLEPEIEKEI